MSKAIVKAINKLNKIAAVLDSKMDEYNRELDQLHESIRHDMEVRSKAVDLAHELQDLLEAGELDD